MGLVFREVECDEVEGNSFSVSYLTTPPPLFLPSPSPSRSSFPLTYPISLSLSLSPYTLCARVYIAKGGNIRTNKPCSETRSACSTVLWDGTESQFRKCSPDLG